MKKELNIFLLLILLSAFTVTAFEGEGTVWRRDIITDEDREYWGIGGKYIAARHPQVDIYCEEIRSRGLTCLDFTVFSPSNREQALHHNEIFSIFTQGSISQNFNDLRVPPNNKYYAGNLIQPKSGIFRFESYHVNNCEGDYCFQHLRKLYNELSNHIRADTLTFFGRGACNYVDSGVPVDCEEETREYVAYNTGEAFGTVRIFETLRDFEDFSEDNRITLQDFLIFGDEPYDVEAPFAGSITAVPQFPDATHFGQRIARRNLPNAYSIDALDKFKEFEGQLVRIKVEEDSYTISPTILGAAQVWWDRQRPIIAPPRPIDPEYSSIDRLTEMQGDYKDWFGRFGGKGSQLATLYQILDSEHQLEGFNIPFYYFYEFMNSNFLDQDYFNSNTHINVQNIPISYFDYAQSLSQDPQLISDSLFRKKVLEDFYDHGRTEGEVDPVLIEQLSQKITNLWNSNTNGYYIDEPDKPVRVRFRSSSNMEDGVEFSGAGLYKSTTVCFPDELDGNTQGPSICDEDDDRERDIHRALSRVWMSLYLPKAYDERDFYRLSQEDAAMAILVNTGIPDEQSNGVAFTGSPGRITSDLTKEYVIHAQLGDESVVSPVEGVKAETSIIGVSHFTNPTTIDYTIQVSTSTLSDEVLTKEQLELMGQVLSQVEREMLFEDGNFRVDLGQYSQEKVILDTEFKFLSDGRFIIKQVRPYLIGEFIPYVKKFTRGDSNNDLSVDISDVITTLEYLFKNEPVGSEKRIEFDCKDAADANDDGSIDISDPIFILLFLFNGGVDPPSPFPEIGIDSTIDGLSCGEEEIQKHSICFDNSCLEVIGPGDNECRYRVDCVGELVIEKPNIQLSYDSSRDQLFFNILVEYDSNDEPLIKLYKKIGEEGEWFIFSERNSIGNFQDKSVVIGESYYYYITSSFNDIESEFSPVAMSTLNWPECLDSDADEEHRMGVNYFERGTLNGFTDECDQSERLLEYYCKVDSSEGRPYFRYYRCQCENGACI